MATPCQLLLLLSWSSAAHSVSHDLAPWVVSTRVVAARLLSISDTYQGCLNSTELQQAVEVYFVDLEDAMTPGDDGWGSVEEACYSFCLNKAPFSERLSLAAPTGNTTYSCGCHLAEELEGLQTVGDAICREGGGGAALYCGPDDRGCYNSAPCTAAPLLLLLLLATLRGAVDTSS